jgi:hypothetical protein
MNKKGLKNYGYNYVLMEELKSKSIVNMDIINLRKQREELKKVLANAHIPESVKVSIRSEMGVTNKNISIIKKQNNNKNLERVDDLLNIRPKRISEAHKIKKELSEFITSNGKQKKRNIKLINEHVKSLEKYVSIKKERNTTKFMRKFDSDLINNFISTRNKPEDILRSERKNGRWIKGKNKRAVAIGYKYKQSPIMNNDKDVQNTVDEVFSKVLNDVGMYKQVYTQGFDGEFKILLNGIKSDGSGILERPFVTPIKLNAFIPSQIKQRLIEQIRKITDGYTIVWSLHKIFVYFYPKSTDGGCNDREKSNNSKTALFTHHILHPKSKNNNCFFNCYNKALALKGNSHKADNVRQILNIPIGVKIDYQQKYMIDIVNYYKRGCIIYNDNFEIIGTFKYTNSEVELVHIKLEDDHYTVIDSTYKINKCSDCGKEYRETHNCNLRMKTYFQKRILKKKTLNFVSKGRAKSEKEVNYNKIIFFDLETFPDKNGVQIPYACGYMYKNKYHMDYGENCLDGLLDLLSRVKKKQLCAYNGSRFDYYILINEFTKQNIAFSDIIMSGGRVLSLKFGNDNKIFDLCLFTNSSLKNACEDFKIQDAKGDFDHDLIKSWSDVETHKTKWEPYLELDVKALKELFIKFNKMIHKLEKINISDFITISQMAYYIWTEHNTQNIEIPNDLDKYTFIKKATFGGRTYPMKKLFISDHYDDVVTGKMSYEELEKTQEYIFNADATGLYPAAMAGWDKMPSMKYPIGASRWTDTPKQEYEDGKYGFYEVKFYPPKNITVPMLPRRVYDNNDNMINIEWSLTDGHGIYTNIDLKNAQEVGYTFDFINEGLVYDLTSDDVFTYFIKKYDDMKQEASREKNDVKRSVSKLLMNALYGKTLQCAIFSETKVINSLFDLKTFKLRYEVTDIHILQNVEKSLLVTGSRKKKECSINKPSHLGAFVTAYSRSIMKYFMNEIDPTFKTIMFSYTDTDSLHVSGSAYKILKEKGLIKFKAEAKLGYLCSDVKNEGLIIQERNIAPKCYRYEYIDNKNIVKTNNNATMKCKGIPIKDNLNKKKQIIFASDFDNETPREIGFKGMKKINKIVSKNDKLNGVSMFSIKNVNNKRTFCKSSWKGMDWDGDNTWYPKGYTSDV